MHALRHVHGLLAEGGTLVDVHPVTEEHVEAASGPIGVILEPDWREIDLPNSEAAVRQTIAEGLYELEAEREYDVLQHCDSADELVAAREEIIAGQDALVAAIRAASPPLVTRMHMVFRRMRALPA